jgi:hypothetical protein
VAAAGVRRIAASLRKQARRPRGAEPPPMFFFFSNKLGCLGSILVSLGLTLLLLFVFNLF